MTEIYTGRSGIYRCMWSVLDDEGMPQRCNNIGDQTYTWADGTIQEYCLDCWDKAHEHEKRGGEP